MASSPLAVGHQPRPFPPPPSSSPTPNKTSPIFSSAVGNLKPVSSSSPRISHASPRSAALVRSSPMVSTAASRSSPAVATSTSPQRYPAPLSPLRRSSNARTSRSTSTTSSTTSPVRKNSSRMATPLVPPQIAELAVSSPKRPRTDSNIKLLPRLYQHCDTADLVVLISDMLGELVGLNDRIPLSTGGLTRFHSRAPPTISIPDYLSRLTLHSTLQPSILLSMVYYIDVLSTLYPTFTISSLTVHRFLITAATVASKGLCDSFLTNSFYAKVGGVSLMELNLLELEFLTRVGWRIVPRGEVLGEYYRSLVGRLSNRYRIDESGGHTGAIMAGEITGTEGAIGNANPYTSEIASTPSQYDEAAGPSARLGPLGGCVEGA